MLKTHSGRQFGGLPIILGWQEQSQRSPCLLGGLEYGPQGLGLQGSSSTIGSTAKTCIMLIWKKNKHYYMSLTQGLQFAGGEGIPNVSLNTGAGGHVVHDPAPCIDTTSTRAGVDAFVPLACFVGGTVAVDNTLWSACYVGISKVFRDTLTCSCTSASLANGIGPTRRWVTWIDCFSRPWWT